jgi:hypothetical protein
MDRECCDDHQNSPRRHGVIFQAARTSSSGTTSSSRRTIADGSCGLRRGSVVRWRAKTPERESETIDHLPACMHPFRTNSRMSIGYCLTGAIGYGCEIERHGQCSGGPRRGC